MRLPNPPKLVIFDCDGVLVNSEPIFNRVLHEFLLSRGAMLTFAQSCSLFTGKSRHDVDQYLMSEGLEVPENWSDEFYENALVALENEVTIIQGVQQVINELTLAKVAFCAASNGLMAKMVVTLGRTQLLSSFEGNMFSAYEIGLSKPAPDVFLYAADANGVQPADCIVVEDSASGFEAAANARMTCFAYLPEESSPAEKLFGAYRFHNMSALPNLIGL